MGNNPESIVPPSPTAEGGTAPAIVITFDAQQQAVGLHFDPRTFKTWDFVLALLGMAKAKAEMAKKLAEVQGFQQAAQRQAQEMALARQLKLS
jgi:hypothetical protein